MAKRRETILRKAIIRELADLDAWLYHSVSGGSQYVKFYKPELGSLRIADHEGRSRYSYKWNIRFDLQSDFEVHMDRGTTRRFYHPRAISRFYLDIREAAKQRNLTVTETKENRNYANL